MIEFGANELGDWFAFFDSKIDTATGEIIYSAPEAGAPEFCIRSMSPFFEERMRTRQKEYKFVHNPVTRGMERVGYYPDLSADAQAAESDDAWDYAIIGWRPEELPFRDKDGKPTTIKCTRENKIKLLTDPRFLRFVQRIFVILSQAPGREDSEKN